MERVARSFLSAAVLVFVIAMLMDGLVNNDWEGRVLYGLAAAGVVLFIVQRARRR